ncbi:hypothetical protein GBF38_017816 [Nibea albiflora]|uniref:Uncharacterized protein n=1 Tax=Nibea albiflora TaxID=240163 RepID=A0ACB7F8Y6_NIBAL|nr:hypothetical protein GBF38_017816 [Nibea albiflora]
MLFVCIAYSVLIDTAARGVRLKWSSWVPSVEKSGDPLLKVSNTDSNGCDWLQRPPRTKNVSQNLVET